MVFFLSLVTMAKGIGNGFPLAAVVTTPGKKQSSSKGWRGMGLVGVEGVGEVKELITGWRTTNMRSYHAQCNCYRYMLHIRMLFYGFEQLCFVFPIGFLCNLIVILF